MIRDRTKYVYPVNSLGEMICLGCGTHFPVSGHDKPKTYCNVNCNARVNYHGGRLTKIEVRKIIEAMP